MKDKQIILFGTGGFAASQYENLRNYSILYCLDNDPTKWEKTFHGHVIYSPDKLNTEKLENIIIVVCSFAYYNIRLQLQSMGLRESEHFTDVRDFLSNAVEDFRGNYSDNRGNKIIGQATASNSKVVFRGQNNIVEFGTNVVLEDTTITFISNQGYCYIGDFSIYRGAMNIGQSGKVQIGERLSVTKGCFITTGEAVAIIGDDCMFASNVEIRCDDAHPIYDIHTGGHINHSKSVSIGDHVWLANRTVVLKGAVIGSGSIIGHSSTVTSRIPNNCVAVGTPARVVRRNIGWERTPISVSSRGSDRPYWDETRD